MEAGSGEGVRAKQALEWLCRAYRPVIVNWFKRRDFRQDPEDLAQAFLVYIIEKSLLNRVIPRTGSFRCFLAASMRNFLRDTWDKEGTQKRGGDVQKVPLLDEHDAEAVSGESQLDIEFALQIHRKAMEQLAPPPELVAYVFQKGPDEGWDEIAGRMNKTSTGLRKEVSRLRRAHWERFRDEVRQIVAPAQQAEETRYLYELLFTNLQQA